MKGDKNRFSSPVDIDVLLCKIDANGAAVFSTSHASTAFHNRHLGYHIFQFVLWRQRIAAAANIFRENN